MAKIDRLKSRLANGNLSQAQAEQVANQIRELGGKVQLTNFGYQGGAKAAGGDPYANGAGGTKVGNDGTVNTMPAGKGNVKTSASAITSDDAGTGWKAEADFGDLAAGKDTAWANPEWGTPWGGSKVSRNPDGSLRYDQWQSEEQDKIKSGIEGFADKSLGQAGTRLGGFGSDFDPTLSDRSMSGDLLDDRRRIEDDVFSRLTRNLDRDKGMQLDDAKTQLKAQGVPFSADPKSRYQTQLRNINESFDERSDNARARATEMGGDEFLRQFGAQEQLRANELSEQGGIRGANFGEVGSMYGWGQGGQMLPNLPGYQPPNPWSSTVTNPYEIWQGNDISRQGWGGLSISGQNADTASMVANRPPQGGGGPQQPSGPPVVAPPSGL